MAAQGVGYTWIGGGREPDLPFSRFFRLAAGEIEGDVGEMKEEGYGVDKNDGVDPVVEVGRFDDRLYEEGAKGVSGQDEAADVVGGDNR